MSKKYTEIHVLKDRLREAGIPYEVQKANDGWQVGIPHLYPEESRISVIEHFASYGSAFDLFGNSVSGRGDPGIFESRNSFYTYSENQGERA